IGVAAPRARLPRTAARGGAPRARTALRDGPRPCRRRLGLARGRSPPAPGIGGAAGPAARLGGAGPRRGSGRRRTGEGEARLRAGAPDRYRGPGGGRSGALAAVRRRGLPESRRARGLAARWTGCPVLPPHGFCVTARPSRDASRPVAFWADGQSSVPLAVQPQPPAGPAAACLGWPARRRQPARDRGRAAQRRCALSALAVRRTRLALASAAPRAGRAGDGDRRLAR